MSSADLGHPFVVHLGMDDALLSQAESDARSHGMRIIELNLTGLSNRSDLVDYLSVTLEFPHEVSGLDAVIDLMSDLQWLQSERGYLVVARGLAEGSLVGDSFVAMLPNIIDRWRSRTVPFVVAVDGDGSGLQSALAGANADMEQSGKLPWAQPGTGSIEVVRHGGSVARDGRENGLNSH